MELFSRSKDIYIMLLKPHCFRNNFQLFEDVLQLESCLLIKEASFVSEEENRSKIHSCKIECHL